MTSPVKMRFGTTRVLCVTSIVYILSVTLSYRHDARAMPEDQEVTHGKYPLYDGWSVSLHAPKIHSRTYSDSSFQIPEHMHVIITRGDSLGTWESIKRGWGEFRNFSSLW